MLYTNSELLLIYKGNVFKLLCIISDIDRCLVLFSPSQWDHVDVEHVDIIMLDDAFGKHNMEIEVLRKWRPKLSTMQTYITSCKLKVRCLNKYHKFYV